MRVRSRIAVVIVCALCGSAGPLMGQDAARPIHRVAQALGVPVLFEPIPVPTRIYLFNSYAPRALQLIGSPADAMDAPPASPVMAVGFFDGQCIHEIEAGAQWTDSGEYDSRLPTWTVPDWEDLREQLVEPVLAFEAGSCPAGVFPRDLDVGLDEETEAWVAERIIGELEDSLGVDLKLNWTKGGTWIVGDGVRQTWAQFNIGEEGHEWWQGGHGVIVGIEHGPGREPRILHRHGPVSGYAAVPFALVDIDRDGFPEVFASFGVPDGGLHELHGLVVIGSDDANSYRLKHLVPGWRVDMH